MNVFLSRGETTNRAFLQTFPVVTKTRASTLAHRGLGFKPSGEQVGGRLCPRLPRDSDGNQLNSLDCLVCSIETRASWARRFSPSATPVPRLLLGGSFSYLFGIAVATGIVGGRSTGVPVAFIGNPLMPYLAHSGAVFSEGALGSDALFEAHCDHVYQRLTASCGLSHLSASLGIFATSITPTFAWFSTMAFVELRMTLSVCFVHFAAFKRFAARETLTPKENGGSL